MYKETPNENHPCRYSDEMAEFMEKAKELILEDTGGGCLMFRLQIDKNRYYGITIPEGCEIPACSDEKVLVCSYDEDGSWSNREHIYDSIVSFYKIATAHPGQDILPDPPPTKETTKLNIELSAITAKKTLDRLSKFTISEVIQFIEKEFNMDESEQLDLFDALYQIISQLKRDF